MYTKGVLAFAIHDAFAQLESERRMSNAHSTSSSPIPLPNRVAGQTLNAMSSTEIPECF